MRTYTRKRPECQYIEDVHTLCRLCLGKPEGIVEIFSDTKNLCAALVLRIMICVGLEITQDSHLPNIICAECYKELDRYYTFRKKCEVTYHKLKSHLLAVKVKENSQIKQEVNICNEGTIKTIEDNEPKIHLSLNNGIFNTIENMNLENKVEHLNKAEDKIEIEIVDNNEILNENNESNEVQLKVQAPTENIDNLGLPTLLSSILLELGILVQTDNGVDVVDQGPKSLELETESGDQFTFQLVEESDGEQGEDGNTAREEETAAQTTEIEVENDIVIQYLTSNVNTSQSSARDSDLCCPVCDKKFASRATLTRHKLVHTGEKPHVCKICGRRFAQREVLNRHKLVHCDVRPFQCSSCGKSFTQRAALATHARTHAPPHARRHKLHPCTHCGKVFLYPSGLSRHEKMHNGHVFECGACERQFNDKSSLLRHLRHAHRALNV